MYRRSPHFSNMLSISSYRTKRIKQDRIAGGGLSKPGTHHMAFMRKTKNMLQLERDLNLDDIRRALLDSYTRNNTLRGVAKEFKVSEATMGSWFRQLGLHTRASLPAVDIPQDLSDIEDATNYAILPSHPRNQPTTTNPSDLTLALSPIRRS